MPNDTLVLMGLIFLCIFLAFSLGNLAIENAYFQCEGFKDDYEKLKKAELENYDVGALLTGKTEVEETGETEVNATEEKKTDLLQWIGNIIHFPDIPGFFKKTVPNWVESIRSTIYNRVLSLPFFKQISFLIVGIRLLMQPCAGLQGISFMIFTPLVLGTVYILIRVLRGGG